ncbi:hypothetical protein NKI49_26375 [Mesorhizobium sp. M0587]
MESDLPGVSVSQVAQARIVTGLLFRWRVQFGVAQNRREACARHADSWYAGGRPCCAISCRPNAEEQNHDHSGGGKSASGARLH